MCSTCNSMCNCCKCSGCISAYIGIYLAQSQWRWWSPCCQCECVLSPVQRAAPDAVWGSDVLFAVAPSCLEPSCPVPPASAEHMFPLIKPQSTETPHCMTWHDMTSRLEHAQCKKSTIFWCIAQRAKKGNNHMNRLVHDRKPDRVSWNTV